MGRIFRGKLLIDFTSTGGGFVMRAFRKIITGLFVALLVLTPFLLNSNQAKADYNSIKYAETEAESNTRSTSYQDKATLTFTPESQGNYLIIGTAELKGSSSSYSVLARLAVDGVSGAA